MRIAGNLQVHPTCVVRTWNARYDEGTDVFATCWDAAAGEFVEVCVHADAPHRGAASAEVLTRWEALPPRLRSVPVAPLTRQPPLSVYAWRASIDLEPPPDRFADALAFAARLHRPQTRKKTTTPYVSHLLAVASIVLEHDGDEDEAIAALLHDAMEDQGGQPVGDEIRRRFGEAVYRIVEDCSDAIVEDRETKAPWRQRKERYIEHVTDCGPSTRLVSAADKLHNARSTVLDLRTFGREVWNRFNASREETLWYYESLVTAFRSPSAEAIPRRTEHLFDELERTVVELGKAG
jgi:hypothetical protein